MGSSNGNAAANAFADGTHNAIAFTDGKAPDAFRSIGEVSRALGIAPHVLRYWEDQFPMLRPVKRSGGRRYYRPEDIRLVRAIDALVNREHYTLRGARQFLESTPRATSNDDPLLTRLRTIRDTLAQALDA